MPKKDEPFTSLSSITIGDTTFHFIRVEGGHVETGRNIAAEVSIAGAGGSYSSTKKEDTTILAIVSVANQIFPLSVWQEMRRKVAEQTGVPVQRIEIEAEEADSQ